MHVPVYTWPLLALVTLNLDTQCLFVLTRTRYIAHFYSGYEVALDVCAALTYIHSKRVVHLDIKSSNILLKHPGTLDTSLSSHLSNEAKFDEEGGFIETTRQSAESPPSGAKLSDVGLARIVPVSHEYIASTGVLRNDIFELCSLSRII
jgi:serine/threonine protein kinase